MGGGVCGGPGIAAGRARPAEESAPNFVLLLLLLPLPLVLLMLLVLSLFRAAAPAAARSMRSLTTSTCPAAAALAKKDGPFLSDARGAGDPSSDPLRASTSTVSADPEAMAADSASLPA